MAMTKKTETKAAAKETDKVLPAEKEQAAAVKVEAEPKAETVAKKEEPVKKEAASKKAEAPKKETVAKKEEPAKKAAAPKKEAVKKMTEKKEVKAVVYVQYAGKEISADSLVEEAKKAYLAEGHKESEIQSIEVYVKPEENLAYYTVNGMGSEDCKICL